MITSMAFVSMKPKKSQNMRTRKKKDSDSSEECTNAKNSSKRTEKSSVGKEKSPNLEEHIPGTPQNSELILPSQQVHVCTPKLQHYAQFMDSHGLSFSTAALDSSAELFTDDYALSTNPASTGEIPPKYTKGFSENNTRFFGKVASPCSYDKEPSFSLDWSNASSLPREFHYSSVHIVDKSPVVSETTNHTLYNRSSREPCDIREWNIPDSIVQGYVAHGISHMFPWQVECLNIPGVLEGRNLVFSAPTSGGKTFISEILMIKKIVEQKQKALMVLPFVSVVREKVRYFQDLLHDQKIKVDGFVGQYSPPGGFASLDIAICTMEKANNLVNKMICNGTLHEIGIFVVDELHILGEPSRGYLLELLLTKVLYFCKMKNRNLQIIGMSATLPDMEPFSSWLEAASYSSSYRPVPLKERIKVGHNIFEADTGTHIRDMSSINSPFEGDDDHVIFLSLETVLNGHSVLIFCPSKTWCENLALKISRVILKAGVNSVKGTSNCYWKNMGPQLASILNMNLLINVMHRLHECPSGLDAVLAETISYGVAFHHAGLTFDERDIIEDGFRNGILKILVATSTLASGVNLPARRVIIRSPVFMGKMIDIRTYKQMAGRAGRKGIDSEGESILICKGNETYYAEILKSQKLPPLESQLDDQNKMERAILEVISCGAAKTEEDLRIYVMSTFLFSCRTKGHQSSENLEKISAVITKCLSNLLNNQFIFVRENSEGDSCSYFPTQLGQATLAAGMAPDLALKFCDELSTARKGFVLENDLHLLYEVIPPSISEQLDFNYCQFSNIFRELSPDKKRFARKIGIDELFIDYCISGQCTFATTDSKRKREIHKHFLAALALQDLIDEKPLSKVATDYGCSRGLLQSMQQNAAVFAGMLKEMCGHLKWHNMEVLFESFQPRIHFGILPELCDLVRLSAVNGQIARILFDAGYINLTTIAKANPVDLENLFRTSAAFNREQSDPDLVSKLWIPGYSAITITSLVSVIVEEAQERVATDIGVKNILWREESSVSSMKTSNMPLRNNTAIPSSAKNRQISCTERKIYEQSVPADLPINIVKNSCERKKNDMIISYSGTESSSQIPMIPRASTPKTEERGKVRYPAKETNIGEIESHDNEMIGTSEYSWNTQSFSTEDVFAAHSCMNIEVPNWEEHTAAKELPKEHVPAIYDINDLKTFLKLLKGKNKFSLALACEKIPKCKIGLKSNAAPEQQNCLPSLNGVYPVGLSIYFGSIIYFISLCESSSESDLNEEHVEMVEKVKLLKQFLEEDLRGHSITVCDINSHYRFLFECCQITLPWSEEISYRDPCIAGWMLNRGGVKPCLRSLVEKYIGRDETILKLQGFIACQGSLALTVDQNVPGRVRSATEALVSFHLMTKLMSCLSERDMLEHFLSTEMPSALIFARRDCRGVGCNSHKLESYFSELRKNSSDMLMKIFQMAGCQFDVHKSTSVAHVLFNRLQLDYHQTVQTKGTACHQNAPKHWKVKKSDLKRLSNLHPLPGAILAFRRLFYICFHVLKPMIKSAKYSQNLLMYRLHGHSNIFGTVGRISICDPPLQMTPASALFVCQDNLIEDIDDDNIRSALIPCGDHVLLSADYKQMELKVMAHLSQDQELIEEINSGIDIFEVMAIVWFKKPASEICKEERQLTKRMVYAMMYGMSQERLRQEYDKNEDDVEVLVQSFTNKFRVLMKFKEKVCSEAQDTGFIRTIGNREIPLPSKCGVTSPRENRYYAGKIFNRLIQGSAADIFKSSMVKVSKEIEKRYPKGDPGAHLVLHIHDELLFEVKKEEVQECMKIIKCALESSANLSVELNVSLKVGPSWGEMENVK